MTAADFFIKSMTAMESTVLRPDLVDKSQQDPQSVRPKLDIEPFGKSGSRTAAVHGRELRAHRSQ